MVQKSSAPSPINELNRTLLAAVVAAVVFVAAVILIDRVPQERATSTTTPTASARTTSVLPSEPTVLYNRLGTLIARDGDTLTVSADTIVGDALERRTYTVRTGSETRVESVDFRIPAATSATATRVAVTLGDIPVGAQVNAVSNTNVVGLDEFAASRIEYHLLPS